MSGALGRRQIRGFCGLCIARCGTIATIEDGRFTIAAILTIIIGFFIIRASITGYVVSEEISIPTDNINIGFDFFLDK